MVDRIEKFEGSKYRIDQTPESQDEEKRRHQEQQEEQESREKQKSKFDKDAKLSNAAPAAQGRMGSSVLTGRAILKVSPEVEPEEESMSVRVLKQWKILDSVGTIRPGVLISYTMGLTAILVSLVLLVRIIFS
jgi:hypothetical protein